MADYNSVYTGTEIDAAIAKTTNMEGLVQVYNGAPTQTEIPASSLPINPATGDRTGLYYIVHASTADALTLANTRTRISMCAIKGITADSSGTSTIYIGANGLAIEYFYGSFHGSTSTFYAKEKLFTIASGNISENLQYIHEIWRFQELA